jgi:hypothetical protein
LKGGDASASPPFSFGYDNRKMEFELANDSPDVQREFGLIAERYRRAERRQKYLAVAFLCCVLAVVVFRPLPSGTYGLGALAVACWFVGFILGFVVPRLQCPNCEQRLEGVLDLYCPACGVAADIQFEGLFERARCGPAGHG